MQSKSRQDYLQEIYRLQQKDNSAIRVSELSVVLNISKASVSEMVKTLSSEGYLEAKRYGRISLTDKGAAVATGLLRKHRIIEKFLCDIFSLDNVHEEAHELEHTVSDRVIDKMDKMLGHPDTCPDGDAIPPKNMNMKPLSDIKPGKTAKIMLSRIASESQSKRLVSLGVCPGTSVKVIRKLAKGPMMIQVKGAEIAIGNALSQNILVEEA
ncbi:MAG: metal-dependent transcriptional regulator [Nanoarchaeota archaeon]|nr:metal-dependent transcriptional regulator [Nanoarchaeota archaeon]